MREHQRAFTTIAHLLYGIELAGGAVSRDAELHIRTEDLSRRTRMHRRDTSRTNHEQIASVGMRNHSILLADAVLIQVVTGFDVSGYTLRIGRIEDMTIRA